MLVRLIVLVAPILMLLPAQTPAPAGREDKVVTVHAQALPTPALAYALLPEINELRTGVVVQAYLKCFMEQNNFYHNEKVLEERQAHLEMPLAELPKSLDKRYGGRMLRYADEAARMTLLDWQATNDLRRDGMAALVPDLHVLRGLANALLLRARLELRDGDFHAALGTLKTLNAMTCHVQQHPTLIGGLVGLAIGSQTCGVVREWQQLPESPNLFWALQRAYPRLVDLRAAWEGERWFALSDIKAALAPESPMDVTQLPKFIEKYQIMIAMMSPRDGQEAARLALAQVANRSQNAQEIARARQRLKQTGIPPQQVDKLPPVQVVLLDELLRVEVLRDELLKWTSMPYWQAEAGLRAAMDQVPKEDTSALLTALLPVVAKVRHSQIRLEQQLVLLMHVEALRHFAATNEGRWPARLDLIGLPLPCDPVNGQPLKYTLEGDLAVLETTPLRPMPGITPVRLHHRWSVRLARP